MSEDNKTGIDVSDLHYYFDAQERDTLDRQGYSRRSSDVLTIRDRLLALPQKDYESVVQTIKNILNPGSADNASQEAKVKRKDASELYDKVRTDKPTTSLKTSVV